MPMPQQLPQIPILRTRYPDPRKPILPHQSQQESGIFAIGLPLFDSLGLDLGGIPDPQLKAEFRQQSLEPPGISGSLHSYPSADSSLLQVTIKSLRFSITMV
jgi:hypothetical protein